MSHPRNDHEHAGHRPPETAQANGRPMVRPPIGWQAPLLDVTSAVLRRWQIFLIVLSLGLMAGVGRYLVTRPFYRSTCVAVLMPREKPPLDVEVTIGSLETTRDLANRGDTGAGMLPARVDLYTSIMRSDAVLTAVGERFASRLRLPDNLRIGDLVHRMRDIARISGTEEGMFNVEATANDPALAADLANALVDEMTETSKNVERQMLDRQVTFLKSSLGAARSRLENAEKALADYIESHGIVDLDKQTGDVLSMIRDAETARQSLVRQRIERLTAFTPEDHVARNLQEQIDEADRNLEELRRRAHGGLTTGGASIQEVKLRTEALRKEVEQSRDLVGTLQAQTSLWELRAKQPAGAIAVIKPAIPLRERAGPSKRDTIGAAMLIAFLLGLVVVMIREQWEKVADEPYLRVRAEEIRLHARLLAPTWNRLRRERRQKVGTPTDGEG